MLYNPRPVIKPIHVYWTNRKRHVIHRLSQGAERHLHSPQVYISVMWHDLCSDVTMYVRRQAIGWEITRPQYFHRLDHISIAATLWCNYGRIEWALYSVVGIYAFDHIPNLISSSAGTRCGYNFSRLRRIHKPHHKYTSYLCIIH